jgi:Uma2 family endonuclease
MTQAPVKAPVQAEVQAPLTPETATSQKLTFEEYRFYEDDSGMMYELFRGHLIPMPTPNALHADICKFLVYQFQQLFARENLPLVAYMAAVGVRTEIDSSRIPDVVICPKSLWEQMAKRKGSAIFDFDEKPLLVVEVTSTNWREDYIRKRAEYALVDLPEYWIADASKQRLRVHANPEKEDGYDHLDYTSGQTVRSPQFPSLNLSVDEILAPPLVEDLIKADRDRSQALEQQVEQERQRAEQEHQRAEQERQRAEQERQRAEHLAELLRQHGINPDRS